ncbi:class I SAM-dependent methyltransferase [Pseudomonas sp. ICMP 561]|uniref:class I SAM-dependent methyltransferase n=1 Tax=Pseudomonas sp. ICMP 561 TaxID=1718918 RepID=UPI000C086EF9|nr:class I SAM-dependent methyltransferase [Pseudomonas sp. ICMP 561]PHN27135.1 SAM-dependent methyltransferase [Pseudomonas sp. ICMP 561]
MSGPVKLKFSEKYDSDHANQYFLKHQDGIARKLSHYRDEQMARDALQKAGEPGLVLDLPCGAGRFWQVLAEKPNRIIIGADNSPDMIEAAFKNQPTQVVNRVKALQTSAFDIDLPDSSVDSIFSMRLIHHIGEAEHRLAMLREFHRVTRETVILSTWVDGNFKSWRRKRHEQKRKAQGKQGDYQNRFVIPREVAEAEFLEAGFRIEDKSDFIPFYAMWRVYVLRKI